LSLTDLSVHEVEVHARSAVSTQEGLQKLLDRIDSWVEENGIESMQKNEDKAKKSGRRVNEVIEPLK